MNNVWTQNQYDRTVAHELIHAYDYCRGKLSKKNILHQACTEVRCGRRRRVPEAPLRPAPQLRAAALSGDCDFRAEAARGIWKWKDHHKVCVRRRAVSSVASMSISDSKEQVRAPMAHTLPLA